MSRRYLLSATAIVLLLASCRSGPSGPPPIGEAFAGPATLTLRQDLPLKSAVVATVKHGDRLDVLQTRRRFVQVRTAQGAVGWTESKQLLSTDQMQDVRRFSQATSNLPSQGAATAYEALNVHTEPSRTSPSFLQVPENASVQVIGHKLAPRTAAAVEAQAPLVQRKPLRVTKKSREREKASRRIPPPPAPQPPKPPANWQELSRPRLRDTELEQGEAKGGPEPAKKSAVMEDWSLIRTRDNKVGWVLSRMLSMSIPDEVAQYAEGHRITSYFPLSDIPEDGQMKHGWLWTTMSHGGQPFEFDGLRVFVWSTHHHRYETVYRERELKGFYPVEATKASGEKNAAATFSILVDSDGQLMRRTYSFNGYRVSLLRREPYTAGQPQTVQVAGGTPPAGAGTGAAGTPPAWYTRLGARVRSWFR